MKSIIMVQVEFNFSIALYIMEPIESMQPIVEEQPVEKAASPPSPVEEPEAPPPTKKPLSKDRLEKLKRARERASQVAKERRERKATPFDDPVIVVEQDESDEDTFEAPPGIIFVRRKRVKKPEAVAEPNISPEMQMLYASMFGSRTF
jgi:hypothetical protein